MSRSLGRLTLDLVARTGGFTGPLDRASRHTRTTSDNMARYAKRIGIAFTGAATAAATGLMLVVRRQRALIDEQAKTAQALNTTFTSLSNLERAGDLAGVSMEKITTASRQLDVNLGRAAQGATAQADALDRLGLSAQELSELPLDERISTINRALRDNVNITERAAVAAELFGARNAAAIQQLSPEVIADAARQVEIFGLNLSDVDAAKVEMANDAMSTFGLLTDGLAKQLTVQLAPALQAIGNAFLDSAEEAGGLGDVVERNVGRMVRALAFVADAGDGIRRVFVIAGNTIVGVLTEAQITARRTARNITAALDSIPGVDMSVRTEGLEAAIREARFIQEEAAAAIRAALEEPLAGNRLVQEWEKAQEAAQEAAEAQVRLREENRKTGASTDLLADATAEAVDQIEKQIAALQLQADTFGMSSSEATLYKLELEGATEAQLAQASAILGLVDALREEEAARKDATRAAEQANREAVALQESFRTQEQVIRDAYERQRQIVLDNTAVTGEARRKLLMDLETKLNEDLGSLNQGYWERYLEGLEERFNNMEELAGGMIDRMSSQFGDAFESMVFDAQSLEESFWQLSESMARSIINALGEMAAQWLAYQAVQMLVGRTTQASAASTLTANAIAAQQMAGINAFSSTAAIPIVGPPAAPAAAAAAIAATAPMVAGVTAASLTGMAHDGIMSVPQTGTWLLQQGERVTTADTSAKLDAMLDRAASGMGSAQVNQTINVEGRVDRRTSNQLASDAARKQRMAQQRFGI